MRAVRVLCCAIALAAFIAPGARADEWNKLTYLTFSAPVQLPGVTLPAGTYAFKLADSWSNRHIVQVFDKDQNKIYGTFLTISDQKLDPSGKPVVMFNEAPAGTPKAVRAWFYPGDTIGDQFVYPKSQAVRIARNAHEPVLAMEEEGAPGNDVSKMKGAKIGHVDENGRMSEDSQDNRANADTTAENTTKSGNAQRATGTTAQAGSAASGTTGVYTAAPREANHRTGVAENSDTMNRYNQGANRTPNSQMAAGGETVTSGRPHQATGTTATGTTASNARANEANTPATTAPRHRASNDNAAATGTSGQANDNTAANRPARHRRRLPQTASPLTLMELLSGVAFGAAAGLRQLRKRYAPAR